MKPPAWLRIVRHRLALARRALFPGRVRHYGDGGTIHQTTVVNVEVGPDGRVAALWYRCALLPFDVHMVSAQRVRDMRHVYAIGRLPQITAIDFVDQAEAREA